MPHSSSRLCPEGSEKPLKVIQQKQCASRVVLGRFLQQEFGVWTEAPEDSGPAFAPTGEREYNPGHGGPTLSTIVSAGGLVGMQGQGDHLLTCHKICFPPKGMNVSLDQRPRGQVPRQCSLGMCTRPLTAGHHPCLVCSRSEKPPQKYYPRLNACCAVSQHMAVEGRLGFVCLFPAYFVAVFYSTTDPPRG